MDNRIAEVRTRARMTKVELAARAGVSRQMLARYEQGAEPTVGIALALAHELGVTVEDLAFERRMIPDTATDP